MRTQVTNHQKYPFILFKMLKIILVHPDFDGSGRVDAVRILVARERIGMEAPKDMANP